MTQTPRTEAAEYVGRHQVTTEETSAEQEPTEQEKLELALLMQAYTN